MTGALNDLVRKHVAAAIDDKAPRGQHPLRYDHRDLAGYRLNCSKRRVTDVAQLGATRGSAAFGARRHRRRRRLLLFDPSVAEAAASPRPPPVVWGEVVGAVAAVRLAAAAVRGSALSRLDRRCRRTATDQAEIGVASSPISSG